MSETMPSAVPPVPPAPPLVHPPRRTLRRRLAAWYRGRSLRSRLAALTALAVAVAIALCALTCWFIVEQRMYDLLRKDLGNGITHIPPGIAFNGDGCASTPQEALANAKKAQSAIGASQPFGGGKLQDIQLVSADGRTVCVPADATRAIVVDPADLTLQPGKTTVRSGTYTDGDSALIRVSWLFDRNARPSGIALTAAPTKPVEESLQQLALILGAVAAVGVVGAGLTGRLIARSALKPVDDLTDVVEHIARTEEVGTTIPVTGNDEIARLSTSFNSMSTALANSRDRQTRLIADAGHELRTPLTSLRTNVDLLIRSNDTGRPLPEATRTKLLGNMKAQMQELTLLIGDLLQLSRPDSPKPGQNLAVVALHEIAGRAVDRARLRGPGLVFELDIAPWYVHGDGAALERAVINLLDNAVKYSPPGGVVDVRLHEGLLTVRDHGPGIPQDELQYVFDRFWRSPSSRQLPGSGLGLSIVAQSVRDAGGEVSLGPARDGGPGAQATVRLPGRPVAP
ncbi:HAMP domain-containing histidine kinase [Kitasatospora sp. NBC_00240]|uniref:HAMP domain-containing sensor histidine kinase n=1 Tax=Kitasatospora sp. NBC_00240 TaxID=2903567 RepID=UPI002255C8CC|nr:HAMP domain-containing sensor histidine kinase [Kitasatospora sp. NBC_00240]MCX5211378.1 HAMP domain-containing histidine kinase [Kitasatospora sp. NBC_00240]